jgi:hypothetical protein
MVSEPEESAYIAEYPGRRRAVLTARERIYFFGGDAVGMKFLDDSMPEVGDVVKEGSQAERSLRQNVRQRLTSGLLDLSILAERMEQRDVDRVFWAELEDSQVKGGLATGYLKNTIPDVIALLFRHQDNTAAFENSVEQGLGKAARVAGYDADINVTINMDRTESLDEILDQLETHGVGGLNGVSGRQLQLLRDAGEISVERYHELEKERHERALERRGIEREGDDSQE